MRNTSGDRDKIINAGYSLKIHTPFHWQVTKSGDQKLIDIWPTAQKILTHYEPGPAYKYTDILQALDERFNPVFEKIVVSESQQQAIDEVQAFREGGIDYLIKKHGLRKD
jgi:hypothetical protein